MAHFLATLQTLGLFKQRKDDEGQTAAEYVGIIVVVAAIILAVSQTNVGTTLATALTTAITQITG